MGSIRKNGVTKFFMLLCAAVQLAAVMPHHHHESSDTPCINPLHSLEAHSHKDRAHYHSPGDCGGAECAGHLCLHNTCTHGHGHGEGGGEGECGYGHLDLNPPVRDRIVFSVPVIPLADHFTLFAQPAGRDACHDHSTGRPAHCCSVFSGTIALYTHICSSSIPARAPSALV